MTSIIDNISHHDLMVIEKSGKYFGANAECDIRNIWLKIKDFFTGVNSNEMVRLIFSNKQAIESQQQNWLTDSQRVNESFRALYRAVTSHLKDSVNFFLQVEPNPVSVGNFIVSLTSPDGTVLGKALLTQEQAQGLERLDRLLSQTVDNNRALFPDYTERYEVMNAMFTAIHDGKQVSIKNNEKCLLLLATSGSPGNDVLALLPSSDIMSNMPSISIDNENKYEYEGTTLLLNEFAANVTDAEKIETAIQLASCAKISGVGDVTLKHYSPDIDMIRAMNGSEPLLINGIPLGVNSTTVIRNFARSVESGQGENKHFAFADYKNGLPDDWMNRLTDACNKDGTISADEMRQVFGTTEGMLALKLITGQEFLYNSSYPLKYGKNQFYKALEKDEFSNEAMFDKTTFNFITNIHTNSVIGVAQRICVQQNYSLSGHTYVDRPIVHKFEATLEIPAGTKYELNAKEQEKEVLKKLFPTVATSRAVVVF
ncbi:hypothetical protein [Escherichia coli]|uniref:hypothetical protein n=1 Tax=Escherichia coli TaxID=562 RepID=UPI002FEEDD78